MQRRLDPHQFEIVHQRAVGGNCLRPHSGPARVRCFNSISGTRRCNDRQNSRALNDRRNS